MYQIHISTLTLNNCHVYVLVYIHVLVKKIEMANWVNVEINKYFVLNQTDLKNESMQFVKPWLVISRKMLFICFKSQGV